MSGDSYLEGVLIGCLVGILVLSLIGYFVYKYKCRAKQVKALPVEAPKMEQLKLPSNEVRVLEPVSEEPSMI